MSAASPALDWYVETTCHICGTPRSQSNCKRSRDGNAVYCGRVSDGSVRQNAGGQYLHFVNGDSFAPVSSRFQSDDRPPQSTRERRDYPRLASAYFRMADPKRQDLATMLGVSASALAEVETGFDLLGNCWVTPERDATGAAIGLSRRFQDGTKRNAGSRGITFSPQLLSSRPVAIFLPEGASDTAALLSMGIPAAGRPSNIGGIALLESILKGFPSETKIVVMGELDRKMQSRLPERIQAVHPLDCNGCQNCWPGKHGAIHTATAIAKSLNRPVKWCFPPDGAKDVRAWVQTKRTTGDSPNWDTLRREFIAGIRETIVAVGPPATPGRESDLPAVDLRDWRSQMQRHRIDSIGQPGFYLDRSSTGAGKTHADISAVLAVVEGAGEWEGS